MKRGRQSECCKLETLLRELAAKNQRVLCKMPLQLPRERGRQIAEQACSRNSLHHYFNNWGIFWPRIHFGPLRDFSLTRISIDAAQPWLCRSRSFQELLDGCLQLENRNHCRLERRQ